MEPAKDRKLQAEDAEAVGFERGSVIHQVLRFVKVSGRERECGAAGGRCPAEVLEVERFVDAFDFVDGVGHRAELGGFETEDGFPLPGLRDSVR